MENSWKKRPEEHRKVKNGDFGFWKPKSEIPCAKVWQTLLEEQKSLSTVAVDNFCIRKLHIVVISSYEILLVFPWVVEVYDSQIFLQLHLSYERIVFPGHLQREMYRY